MKSDSSLWKSLLFVAIVASILSVASCDVMEPMFFRHPNRTSTFSGPESSYVGRLSRRWIFDDASSWRILSTPAMDANGNIYFGVMPEPAAEDSPTAYCVSTSGWVKWATLLPPFVTSSPCVSRDGSLVYFTTWAGDVFALYTSDGAVAWSYRTEAEIGGSPNCEFEPALYVGSYDGHMYALDLEDGDVIWTYKTGAGITSTPLVLGNEVVFGSWDGQLHCVDKATGVKKWAFRTASGIVSSPGYVHSLGLIVVGSMDFCVYAVVHSTGKMVWKFCAEFYVASSPATTNVAEVPVVYIGGEDGYLYSLDARDGRMRWKRKSGAWLGSSPVVSKDGIVYYGNEDLRALNPDGTTLWRMNLGSTIYSSPLIAMEGVVYVAAGGNLFAVEIVYTQIYMTVLVPLLVMILAYSSKAQKALLGIGALAVTVTKALIDSVFSSRRPTGLYHRVHYSDRRKCFSVGMQLTMYCLMFTFISGYTFYTLTNPETPGPDPAALFDVHSPCGEKDITCIDTPGPNGEPIVLKPFQRRNPKTILKNFDYQLLNRHPRPGGGWLQPPQRKIPFNDINKYSPIQRTAHYAVIQNGYIFGDGVACDENRIFLPDPVSHGQPLPPTVTQRHGKLTTIVQTYSFRYYNFIAESLPRLMQVYSFIHDPEINLLVDATDTEWWEEIEQLLRWMDVPVNRIVKFRAGELHYARTLYYPPPTSASHPSRELICMVREKLRNKLLVTSGDHASNLVVYVSQDGPMNNLGKGGNGWYRTVMNEREVVASLSKAIAEINAETSKDAGSTLELRVVKGIEQYSVAAEIFSRAAAIVGHHGEAFSNMIFSQPNTVILEFGLSVDPDLRYWHLANALGHCYAMVVAPETMSSSHSRLIDADTAASQFKAAMTEMCLD